MALLNTLSNGTGDYISFKFDAENIGYVLALSEQLRNFENAKNTNQIAVYIPKIMTEINMKNGMYTTKTKIKPNLIKNQNIKVQFSNSVTLCNYLKINKPSSSSVSISKATKINVCFENGNIQKAYYDKLVQNNY